MQILPAINCDNLSCVEERVRAIKKALPQVTAIHIDVADGTFTPNISWNNADELKAIIDFYDSQLIVGVHLMVDNPEAMVERWIRAGAKEMAVHLERLTDRDFFRNVCVQYDAEPVIAVSPETSSRTVLGYVDDFKKILILGVNPGLSGQVFQTNALDKIKEIKWAAPNVIIEVDGGVNPENIKSIREAGADIVFSGSYLFAAADLSQAYANLTNA
jgi:ribulose-phosphate 3-epimerase